MFFQIQITKILELLKQKLICVSTIHYNSQDIKKNHGGEHWRKNQGQEWLPNITDMTVHSWANQQTGQECQKKIFAKFSKKMASVLQSNLI